MIRSCRVPAGAVALVLEGEVGIGKTTIWSELVERAVARAYQVLRCSPAEAEARMSYAALSDLLSLVDKRAFAPLPDPQRRAVDAVLLRADPAGDAVDQRAVCAATAALLLACATERPTVVAADDVQWLDAPSARVVAYALRRVACAPIGFLFTVRGSGSLLAPLGLDRALDTARVRRLTVPPLSLGALREPVFAPARLQSITAVALADRTGIGRQPVLRTRDGAGCCRLGRRAAPRGRHLA